MEGMTEDQIQAALANERAYVEGIIELGKKHGLSLGHEDSHGAFEIEPRSAGGEEWNDDWLRQALKWSEMDYRKPKRA